MFASARLKLTAWYLVIIMVISVSFSVLIYKISSTEIKRFERLQRIKIERTYAGTIITFDPSLIQEAERRMLLNLIILNVAIAAVSSVAGYFLSGVTLAPIKEMLDEQNRFISDASHELGTPLTSLKLAMEVYLRGKKKTISESETLVKESIVEVNKLQSLSRNLLELASFQKPTTKLSLSKFDLKMTVGEVYKKLRPIANKKNIKIKLNLESINIEADKTAISEVVGILIDNAIKYSPAKTSIVISLKKEDGYGVVEIKDNGIGISEEDIPHIFDRFYRADSARSNGGYGLGLSIARKIIDLHHGRISVESKADKGSTFTVSLPIQQSFSKKS